jgi:MFS family permease
MFLPLLGRMVSGFGEGYVSAMYGELARITTEDERTRYFAIIKANYIIGIVVGPALNLFLKEFDFYIGNWHIDFRTSPGFFMALMWILATGIMFVFVYDLSDEMRKEKGYEPVSDCPSEEQFSKKEQLREVYGNNCREDEHGQMTSPPAGINDVINSKKLAEKEPENDSNESSTGSFKYALADIFMKPHIVAVVYSNVFMAIFHTSLQAVTPLVAERMLNWSETDVSLLFTFWGVEIIIVAIILCMLSSKVSDRLLLLMSTIFGSIASVGAILLACSSPMSNSAYYSLLVTIFVEGIPMTILYVVGRSLISKHTSPDNQGLVQAILTALGRVALLSGPLIGSSLFTHQKIWATILAGSQIMGLILVILVFNKLKVNPSKT